MPATAPRYCSVARSMLISDLQQFVWLQLKSPRTARAMAVNAAPSCYIADHIALWRVKFTRTRLLVRRPVNISYLASSAVAATASQSPPVASQNASVMAQKRGGSLHRFQECDDREMTNDYGHLVTVILGTRLDISCGRTPSSFLQVIKNRTYTNVVVHQAA